MSFIHILFIILPKDFGARLVTLIINEAQLPENTRENQIFSRGEPEELNPDRCVTAQPCAASGSQITSL